MGIDTGQCTILEDLVGAGVGTTREKGGMMGQQKDKQILTTQYEVLVPEETEGRRGGLMAPKSSNNSLGFVPIISYLGRALSAMGMAVGILVLFPGLLCYCCLI